MLKFFVFRIPKHGKGEVDHTGGVAKSTIRWEIANGAFFADVTEMVLMVEGKFGDQQHPKYVINKNSLKILAALPMWTVQRRSWKKYSISYMALILWYY